MAFFDKLFNKGSEKPAGIEVQSAPLLVCAPFTGTAMKLSDIPDPVFSEGVLGPGCGLEPEEEVVYAPFGGTISQVSDTKHAIGITSSEGVELLIHVGMDTVDMNGKGFECFVQNGQNVQAGMPLMRFSRSAIKEANHPATTAIVLTNADDFSGIELLIEGNVQHGAPLIQIKK